jgi:hypothetical protein
MKQAIILSLRGGAALVMRYMGANASLDDVLAKLEQQYIQVVSCDKLLQDFFQLSQDKGEKVQNFASRLEGALNKIRIRYPNNLTVAEEKRHLKERLFHGMKKNLRDSIRYLFDNEKTTFNDLLIAARRAEAESPDKVIAPVKAKATSVGSDEMSDCPKGNDQLGELKTEIVQLKQLFQNHNNQRPKDKNKDDDKSKDKKKTPVCYKCGGLGHFKRDCPSQGNFYRGDRREGRRPSENTQETTPSQESPSTSQQ